MLIFIEWIWIFTMCHKNHLILKDKLTFQNSVANKYVMVFADPNISE